MKKSIISILVGLVLVAGVAIAQGPRSGGYFPIAKYNANVAYKGIGYELPVYDSFGSTFTCNVFARGTNNIDTPIIIMAASNTVQIQSVSFTLDEFVAAMNLYTNQTDALNNLVAEKLAAQLP